MNSKTLTHKEALLLQRYVDEEVDVDEREEATTLLEESAPARVYLAALKALRKVMQIAEEEVWRKASLPSPEEWVELAENSADLIDTPLDDLAPVLERFHDGEVDETEAAVVAALVDERDDVAEYLSELDRLSAGIRQAGASDDVDFGGFWDSIEHGICEVEQESIAEPIPVDPFDAQEHSVLLYRYHDGEAKEDGRRRVQRWIQSENEEVDSILGALAEIHVGVNAGIEVAREDAELDQIWTHLGDHLDAIDAERVAGNVVSFDAPPASTPAPAASWNRPIYAIVAAVVLLTMGALLGPNLLQTQDELVETRTVVIFDTVESEPGSSFRISQPELAGHDRNQDQARYAGDEMQPTVLWLIDDEEEDEDEDEEESEEEAEELPGPI